MSKLIFISAGEASGDLLASRLIKAIHSQRADLKIVGMGSKLMQEAGAEIIINCDEIAVVGFWEIIKHFKKIKRAFNYIKYYLQQNKPDLIILVDYPGFNLRLAKIAKGLGIKVLYYVSPQIWAWRYGRIKKIKQYVDHMAVLFKFEEEIYQRENMPVSFVGHPLADHMNSTLTKEQAYQQFSLDMHNPIIALVPGSRHNEISRLLPIMMEAVALIKKQLPNAQFILPLANCLEVNDVARYLTPDIQIIQHNTYNILPICDVAITASGTVTLELALFKVPMVIIYKVALITELICRLLVRVKYIGLCNIISQECVAKELIQKDATPTAIAQETINLLQNLEYRHNILNKLGEIKQKLGGHNNAEKAAALALELLN